MLVLVVPFSVAANLRLPEFLSSALVVRGASGGVREGIGFVMMVT